MNIGERIKELREQNGITQSALAKMLGISRSAVNAWELSISIPSVPYLIELAAIFHVSTDYLLCLSSAYTVSMDRLNFEEQAAVVSLIRCLEKAHSGDMG